MPTGVPVNLATSMTILISLILGLIQTNTFQLNYVFIK